MEIEFLSRRQSNFFSTSRDKTNEVIFLSQHSTLLLIMPNSLKEISESADSWQGFFPWKFTEKLHLHFSSYCARQYEVLEVISRITEKPMIYQMFRCYDILLLNLAVLKYESQYNLRQNKSSICFEIKLPQKIYTLLTVLATFSLLCFQYNFIYILCQEMNM